MDVVSCFHDRLGQHRMGVNHVAKRCSRHPLPDCQGCLMHEIGGVCADYMRTENLVSFLVGDNLDPPRMSPSALDFPNVRKA